MHFLYLGKCMAHKCCVKHFFNGWINVPIYLLEAGGQPQEMACLPGNQWLGGVPIWFEDPSAPPVYTFPLGCCKRLTRVLIACRTNSCSQWGRMVVVEEEGLLSKLIPEPKPFKNQSWFLTVWPWKVLYVLCVSITWYVNLGYPSSWSCTKPNSVFKSTVKTRPCHNVYRIWFI